MRIIIASVSFPPNISGVAFAAFLLAKYLVTKGHEIVVITPGKTAHNYIKNKNGIIIHRLAAIPNPFRSGFFLPFAPAQEVNKIVNDFKPDLIHIHDPTNVSIALLREARSRDIPILATNHFTIDYVLAYLPKSFHSLSSRVLTAKIAQFYNQCDALICPSKIIADFYKKTGVKKPIVVISNGVDTGRFKPLKGKTSERTVLYLGRIDRDKSLDVLIEAFRKVRTQIDANLILVGSGDYRKKLRQLVIQKKLTKHVRFSGAINHEDPLLVTTIRKASVFAIASTIESQSIATMEAMACGKPIVAARAQALPELVKNNINGYLFSPGNSTQMAQGIIKLLKNRAMRSKMGANSRRLAQKHDLLKSHQTTEKVYKRYGRGGGN